MNETAIRQFLRAMCLANEGLEGPESGPWRASLQDSPDGYREVSYQDGCMTLRTWFGSDSTIETVETTHVFLPRDIDAAIKAWLEAKGEHIVLINEAGDRAIARLDMDFSNLKPSLNN